jgi:hypothetical protein
VAVVVYVRQLKHQSLARDFNTFLEFHREAGALWANFRGADDDNRTFHLGQLMVIYEWTCRLHNRGVIGVRIADMIKHHVIEVFLALLSDEGWRRQIASLVSGRNTYDELVRFFRVHKRDYEAHWDWVCMSGLAGEPSSTESPL